jgi:hypothetical protein
VNQHEDLIKLIQEQAAQEKVRITQHAQREMAEEGFSLTEVFQAIQVAELLENYPEHRRGACCLINGKISSGRALHIVCTTSLELLIIITVYEPKPPKWPTPTQRGK